MERLPTPDPTDVSDDAWTRVAPQSTPIRPDTPQQVHDPREVSNARRRIVRTSAPWRMLPTTFPPSATGSQQARRWIDAGCFAGRVDDPRALRRWSEGRADAPTAAVVDTRTVQSSPERGAGVGWDGHARKQAGAIPVAVDPLVHRPALVVIPADSHDRAEVAAPAAAGQEAMEEMTFVNHGDTGPEPAAAAAAWRSSHRQGPRAASCGCRAGGSSNAPSRRPPASAGWPATTNACRKRSPARISSPPRARGSIASSPPSPTVRHRLQDASNRHTATCRSPRSAAAATIATR